MKQLAKSTLLIVVFVFTTVSNMPATAGKLYKWVDDEGNISYQDQPPPTDANVLDEREVKSSGSSAPRPAGESNKLPVFVYVVDDCEN